MKYITILLAFMIGGCAVKTGKNKPLHEQLASAKLIDLTYSFDNTTVFWPTASDFKLTVDFAGTTESGYYYEANTFALAEHGGTHIDAPIHFAEGRQSVDQIPLNNLMGNGIVVDISEPALQNRDYLLSVDDLEEWESSNGSIMEGTIVLVRTGYGRYWPDREKYMGTAERGAEAVADLHFPGIHPDAAAWLAEKNVKAVGIDTPSIDYGQSKDFKAHQTLYLKNIPGFENVANLDQLPEKGFTIIALPMKINNGSGGPLRIIAAL